jgi:hypothetical protein
MHLAPLVSSSARTSATASCWPQQSARAREAAGLSLAHLSCHTMLNAASTAHAHALTLEGAFSHICTAQHKGSDVHSVSEHRLQIISYHGQPVRAAAGSCFRTFVAQCSNMLKAQPVHDTGVEPLTRAAQQQQHATHIWQPGTLYHKGSRTQPAAADTSRCKQWCTPFKHFAHTAHSNC